MLQLLADDGDGLTVQVSVQATDSYPLHYQWRSTDGVIQDKDKSSTTWTLPKGPGLYFAYVLVSNRMGGRTPSAVSLSTLDRSIVMDAYSPLSFVHSDVFTYPGGRLTGPWWM